MDIVLNANAEILANHYFDGTAIPGDMCCETVEDWFFADKGVSRRIDQAIEDVFGEGVPVRHESNFSYWHGRQNCGYATQFGMLIRVVKPLVTQQQIAQGWELYTKIDAIYGEVAGDAVDAYVNV